MNLTSAQLKTIASKLFLMQPTADIKLPVPKTTTGTGQARFRQADAPPAATLSTLRWTIMPLTEGAAASVDPGVRTWSEYRAALATLNRGAANWQMVPTHELAAA
jgi:hypothetical protein